MEHSDQDLRERFAALRREDAAQAPGFAVPGQGRTQTPWSRRMPDVGLAALVLASVVFFTLHRGPERPAHGQSITEWKSPTDFLLQTPGRELLNSVPAFTQWPLGVAPPAATPKPFSKKRS
jgi:hypothetical protein